MIIAGLQAGPNGTGGPPGQDKPEDPKYFAPPAFLQPPGQEQQQSAAEKEKQQKAAEAAAAVLSKKNIQPEDNKSNKDKSRPMSSTPVPGTPWCVVWTGDSRSFFYNPR